MNTRILLSLLRNVKIKTYKKGEILIVSGSFDKDIFYIKKGLVRSFLRNNENEEEITFQLYCENDVFSNVHTILFNEPSRFNYHALEDLKVYIISYDLLKFITSKKTELLEINRTIVRKSIIERTFSRVESFVFLSPEERYAKFVKDNPKLIHRVADKYIANILGITPVSLSRIRSRITNKKS